jgi:alginate O-acetyltransferase complex protein AlgI
MLFTQLSFLVFLAPVLIGHVLTRRWKSLNEPFLVLASWCFFVYWSLTDFLIFFAILAVNFVLVRALGKANTPAARKGLLLLSVGLSLGALALFKYRQFFSASVAGGLHWLGVSWRAPSGSLAIPLAISFYTFHLISLVIDVHARKCPAPGFRAYALYLSFFPQMLAGPIVRSDQVFPQIDTPPRDRPTDLLGAVYLFVLGFAFKAVVADNIADAIDPCWLPAGLATLSTLDAWCVAGLYSCQIFADFGGYSFMALGLGKLFGFELPENFRAPYLAGSFREFWQRWHISLSSFLRDYLYIGALGGSRGPRWRTHVNLLVTMLLGGLWHGPAWNFVAWGGLHGLGLVGERLLGLGERERRPLVVRAIWFLVVQLVVVLAWVLFRAPGVAFAVSFLRRMFVLDGTGLRLELAPPLAAVGALSLPVVAYHLAYRWPALGRRGQPVWLRGALTGALVYAILVVLHSPRGFIYFVF